MALRVPPGKERQSIILRKTMTTTKAGIRVEAVKNGFILHGAHGSLVATTAADAMRIICEELCSRFVEPMHAGDERTINFEIE